VTASIQLRILSFSCAIAVGVTAWELTSKRWIAGGAWGLVAAVTLVAYIVTDRRRAKGQKGRRY
jgi:hypothetical protein